MARYGTVLILGSAPDVLGARDWPRAGLDAIVAINNAWQVRPDWDRLVHPKDFPAERLPPWPASHQSVHSYPDYVPAVNAYGGFVFGGGTMAFTAAYWVLHALRPRLVGFFGCDMVYPATGPTHFYGSGTADPMRPDPTLQSLEAKSARLMLMAAAQGCVMVNLSDAETSRLVFPRLDQGSLRSWRPAVPDLDRRTGLRIAEARRREIALGYEVPSGKYWKEFARIDPAALRRIDRMWLNAAAAYVAADQVPGLMLAVT